MKYAWFILIAISLWILYVYSGKPNLAKLTPKKVVSLLEKESYNKDSTTLQQLIYFPPNTTEAVKYEMVKRYKRTSVEEKALRFFMSAKPEYEKVLDEETAEVGVVMSGLAAIRGRQPLWQYILKKDGGVWKIFCDRYDLSESQLISEFQRNPKDYSILYLMACHIQPENFPKAGQYYLKYYELDPKGFWVCDDFVQQISEYKKEFNSTAYFEMNLLLEIHALQTKQHNLKAVKYKYLGQLFSIKGDYTKAEQYFLKAEQELKRDPDPLGIERLQKSRQELQLRKEGKYKDILDMIPPK
jgi:hypothetical protein